MRRKSFTSAQQLLLILSLGFLVGSFLIGILSIFHSKEVNLLVEGCYEINGTPVLEASYLHINYSFQCVKT
ncbi:hypothetical protein [Bacillus sp. 2205SS5-2]|uniref:hypothetical protein n=1 Tax=Bacillus sp. 2205SS5-2 TaxID=3109031 RepID=UPI003003F469